MEMSSKWPSIFGMSTKNISIWGLPSCIRLEIVPLFIGNGARAEIAGACLKTARPVLPRLVTQLKYKMPDDDKRHFVSAVVGSVEGGLLEATTDHWAG